MPGGPPLTQRLSHSMGQVSHSELPRVPHVGTAAELVW